MIIYLIKVLQKQKFLEEDFKNKSDISKKEWQNIFNLKKCKDIIMKEVKKGGAVAIMNTKKYIKIIDEET